MIRGLVGVVLVAGICSGLGGGPAAADDGHVCDPIAADCLLPFPNDWFTVPDRTAGTGRRIHLNPAAMPRNVAGLPINPAQWNRADGFSPGSMLLAHIPGVDLTHSGAAPVTDIGASLRTDAPIVIMDAATGERWPYWAEMDANDPRHRALIVRPARNLTEGHHYVVALRDLRDSSGARIAPDPAFTGATGERRRALRPVLRTLARYGIGTENLNLAWDFTVASERSLAGTMLAIRDDAFARLGARAPKITVTSVRNLPDDPDIAREVTGAVRVPGYLNLPGGPTGSSLRLDENGDPRPLPGNVQPATFQCEIPRSALNRPARAALYGHGLLGDESEVAAANVKKMAAEHGFVFCAARWIGLAKEDLATVAALFGDFSHFNTVPDRLRQAMLDFQFLGRAMTHPDGLTANAAFQNADGDPVIDVRDGVVYDGNSQGGGIGGALVATSTDIRRGALGVPAMNYSTLLNRSVDFAPFQALMNASYPDKLGQQEIFALLQMLWDRGEADAYAAHMTTDPYPGTPPHRVLMHVAFGDHQVANVASDVEARTIGARIHTPAIAPGRDPDTVPYWGIPPLPAGPYAGSAVIIWDSGTPAAPTANVPPSGAQYGHDPHEDPRNAPAAREQKSEFLKTGRVVDVCDGAPCQEPPVS